MWNNLSTLLRENEIYMNYAYKTLGASNGGATGMATMATAEAFLGH